MGTTLTKLEKGLACGSFCILAAAIVLRGILGPADLGVWIVLAVTAVMIWLLFFACAFFPADWRMTEKQRQKIRDPERHQRRYRLAMIGFDAVAGVLFALLILLIG